MNLHRQMSAIDGDVTPASLTEKLKRARDEPSFMAHPYTCDGQQVTILPAICNTSVRLLQYKGGGRFDDLVGNWVSGASLVKLLTG